MNNLPDTPLALMYHGIIGKTTIVPPLREEGADLYDISVENFSRQIEWLHNNHYMSVACGQADSPETTKKIILTFDDGEENNYIEALPILIQHRFRAYFFITVGRVGKDGYMDWPKLHALHQAGMTIGSHGLSHEILTNLKPTQIYEELRASKITLERNLKITVEALSIPRGFYNDTIITTARQLGYRFIFISGFPKNLPKDCIGRLAVKHDWPLKRFILAVQNKKSFMDVVSETCLNATKTVLGGHLYDKLRTFVLNIQK